MNNLFYYVNGKPVNYIFIRSKALMKDSSSSVANNGYNSYIIIHVSSLNSSKQQRNQIKEPDPVTKCSKYNSSRSTQVYPYDLDADNVFHPKNQSTQTDKLRQRDHGVQSVRCSQSSSASQTACFLDMPDNNSYRSSAPPTYPSRLIKNLKLDGPIIHGPFSCCDCPGGVDFCKHDRS